MRRSIPAMVLGLVLLTLGACSSKPPQPTPAAVYQRDAVVVTIHADAMLNQYEGQPHTLLLYLYQLKDPNAFNGLREDDAGLARLLEGTRFDPAVVASKRIFVQPGDQLQLVVDRAEGAKYVGVVAGYYDLDRNRSTRLYEIPVLKEEKGWVRKKTSYKFGKLSIELLLGPDGIRG